MSGSRGVAPEVTVAIDRALGEVQPYWGSYSAPVEVTFPAANTILDIVHGLGQKPDGYHVVWADGLVYAEPGVLWTKELAFMRATSANVHAIIVFFTLRETRNET